jgi:hypothetical protein
MRARVTVPVESEFGNEHEIMFQMFPDRVLLHLQGIPNLVEYVVLDWESMDQLYNMLTAMKQQKEAQNGS